MEIETPDGGKLERGGAAGEALDGVAIVGGGERAASMGVPVALLAENEIVGGAADGDGLGRAVVADLGAKVLAGEKVGGVNVLVAEQAELGGVGPTVENSNLVAAEIARHALRASRFGRHHFSLDSLLLLQLQLLLLLSFFLFLFFK